jgi:hypothetical protein
VLLPLLLLPALPARRCLRFIMRSLCFGCPVRYIFPLLRPAYFSLRSSPDAYKKATPRFANFSEFAMKYKPVLARLPRIQKK